MYTLKEIAKITEGKILKGDAQTSITEFSIRRKEHCKGAFYIPIFCNEDRQQYITEAAKAYMPGKVVKHFDTQEALIDFLLSQVKEGDLLYFKASKKMGFDKIVKKLLEQERN